MKQHLLATALFALSASPAFAQATCDADAVAGDILWTQDLGGPIFGAVALDDDNIYSVTYEDRGRAYSVARETGAINWEQEVIGGAENAVALHDGVLFANLVLLDVYANQLDENGLPEFVEVGFPAFEMEATVAISASTGALLWHTDAISGMDSAPVIDKRNDLIISGTVYNHLAPPHVRRGKKIYAFDATTGVTDWELDIDGWSYCSYAMSASPGIFYAGWESDAGDGVAFGGLSGYGRFAAVDSTTGEILWDYEANSPFSRAPAVFKVRRMGDRILAGTQNGHIFHFDKDGGVLWENNLEIEGYTGLVLGPNNESVYLTTNPGDSDYAYRLLSLNTWTGSVEWSVELLEANSPVVGDAAIYVADAAGNFYSIDTDGNILWQLDLDEAVAKQSAVVLDDCGVAYIGTEDGTLFAIQTESSGVEESSDWPRYRGDQGGTGNPDR